MGNRAPSRFQILSGQEADNHIFRFVKSKFGYIDPTDFETRLYLCLPIFQPLNWHYYVSMNQTFALTLYAVFVGLEVTLVVISVFNRWGAKAKSEEETKENRDGKSEESDFAFVFCRILQPGWCYHIGNYRRLTARSPIFFSHHLPLMNN